MNRKAQVFTLAMLSIVIQHGQVLSDNSYGYGSNVSNYPNGSGYSNQGYSMGQQGQNPGYYYNQGSGYEVQVNEQGNRYGRENSYNHPEHRMNQNNEMRENEYNHQNHQRMHDQNSHMRNMRADSSDATPRSYPLEDGSPRDSRYNNDARDSEDGRNRQYISDNTMNTGTQPYSNSAMQNDPRNQTTVVEMLTADPSFSTLVRAITAAGLVETLNGKGPFTIFAPNNQAFQKIPADQLSDLMKPENKQKLAAILKYHVIPGKIMAADVVSAKVNTVQGKPLDLKVNGSKVTVNNANVIKPDLAGSNGVIHVIDTVIIP